MNLLRRVELIQHAFSIQETAHRLLNVEAMNVDYNGEQVLLWYKERISNRLSERTLRELAARTNLYVHLDPMGQELLFSSKLDETIFHYPTLHNAPAGYNPDLVIKMKPRWVYYLEAFTFAMIGECEPVGVFLSRVFDKVYWALLGCITVSTITGGYMIAVAEANPLYGIMGEALLVFTGGLVAFVLIWVIWLSVFFAIFNRRAHGASRGA